LLSTSARTSKPPPPDKTCLFLLPRQLRSLSKSPSLLSERRLLSGREFFVPDFPLTSPAIPPPRDRRPPHEENTFPFCLSSVFPLPCSPFLSVFRLSPVSAVKGTLLGGAFSSSSVFLTLSFFSISFLPDYLSIKIPCPLDPRFGFWHGGILLCFLFASSCLEMLDYFPNRKLLPHEFSSPLPSSVGTFFRVLFFSPHLSLSPPPSLNFRFLCLFSFSEKSSGLPSSLRDLFSENSRFLTTLSPLSGSIKTIEGSPQHVRSFPRRKPPTNTPFPDYCPRSGVNRCLFLFPGPTKGFVYMITVLCDKGHLLSKDISTCLV